MKEEFPHGKSSQQRKTSCHSSLESEVPREEKIGKNSKGLVFQAQFGERGWNRNVATNQRVGKNPSKDRNCSPV